MKMRNCAVLAALLILIAPAAFAQDDFGFGFGGAESGGTASAGSDTSGGDTSGVTFSAGPAGPSVTISGKAETSLTFYGEDLSDYDKFKKIKAGDMFSGALNFSASAANAEAVINLNLTPDFDHPENIVAFDEAYGRFFFGDFTLEGGLRKLTWGKADSLGPLDVVNALDYSDLSKMGDVNDIKLARPMLHPSFSVGNFTKIEAVWVPWFEGTRFATDPDNRWAPKQLTDLPGDIVKGLGKINPQIGAAAAGSMDSANLSLDGEQLKTIEYSQAGLRFTTTIGSNDIGAQYYTGFLGRPAVTISGARDLRGAVNKAKSYQAEAEKNAAAAKEAMLSGKMADAAQYAAEAKRLGALAAEAGTKASAIGARMAAAGTDVVDIRYNRFHQIGVDYARVIAGFNLRAEAAVNLTDDMAGDKGDVYNPTLAWSLGFDRDIVWGINGNFQCNESIRLMNDKIDDNRAIDTEAGTHMTNTRFTFQISKKLFRDELELKSTILWGVEDNDCYIIPAAVWTRGDVSVELSGGIFAGDEEGELGQYRHNNFVKAVVGYAF